MKSFGSALLVALVAIAVSACGDARSPAGAPQPTEQAVITGTPAGSNANDVAFASATASSYGQASELTTLVPKHSTNPNVMALASKIAAAQVPDLETMKVFLVQWGSNSDGGPAQDAQAGAAPGTVDDATMAQLRSLRGKNFDTVWLRAMIGHQQGAVALAQAEVAKGLNVDAVATAKRLVGTYDAQIAKMQQLLANG
jgi:uncharacterized protein (DUF305 family)